MLKLIVLTLSLLVADDIAADDITCTPTADGGMVCETHAAEPGPGCTRTCGPNGDCTPWVCPADKAKLIVIRPPQ